MGKKRIPKLLVVFDTNVLFTQVASDLVRNDVQRIISENSSHPDLSIAWYLPEVVIGERKYQMLGKAKELLPNMQKLERLLGHKFGVGEDTLELHVDKAIKENVDKLQLQKCSVDTSKIDWGNIIDRSVYREPPFEPNEKEKGFRDSVIAHSFDQLRKASPATPSVCRLALVSEDQRLREYVSELTNGTGNVRVLKSLDELESLINTLVATIPEEFAIELAKKATKLFFEKQNMKTFYYKENISEKIKEQYSSELSNTYMPGHLRTDGTWWISEPIFIKKVRQRIYWVSNVEPEFEISHFEKDETPQGALAGLADILKSQGIGENSNRSPSNPVQGGISQGLLRGALPHKKVIDIKGKERLEVHWSANLSQAQNLTSPKLEKILYVGNNVA